MPTRPFLIATKDAAILYRIELEDEGLNAYTAIPDRDLLGLFLSHKNGEIRLNAYSAIPDRDFIPRTTPK